MHHERIDHPHDPRLDDYRDLTDAQARDRRGVFIAEGRLVVRTLLAASASGGFRPKSILCTDAAMDSLRDLLGPPNPGGAPVFIAPPHVLDAVAGFHVHRGCLAAADRGAPRTLDHLLTAAGDGPSTLLALEAVNNHDNIGGIFRNAAAFGAAGVLLSPGCVDPLYRKAVRVSMGGVLRVPFAAAVQPRWPADLDRLRQAGFSILALTPRTGSIDLHEFGGTGGRPIPPRRVLMLGAEGPGLSDRALSSADLHVRIPIVPGMDSLNVATASGIALHALAR